jgi:hypothetical protein
MTYHMTNINQIIIFDYYEYTMETNKYFYESYHDSNHES